MMDPLQRRVDDLAWDDLVWTVYGALELTREAECLWKRLSIYSDGTRARVISHTSTRATEHYCNHVKLCRIQRELPCAFQGSLEPLLQHHGAMYERYNTIHTHLLSLERVELGVVA
jgi:hypothetical protein